MILKTTRVPTSDAEIIADYFDSPGENEKAGWLRGDRDDILLAAQIARMAGRTYAIRHIMISPEVELTRPQLDRLLDLYCTEFGATEDQRARITITLHKKARQGGGHDLHFHGGAGEVCSVTGKVLDSSHMHIRNEYVCRAFELEQDHPVVPGRFNKEVYNRLAECRPDLDLAPYRATLIDRCVEERGMTIEEATDRFLEFRAYATYSSGQQRRLKRIAKESGVDLSLPALMADLRKRWAETESLQTFVKNDIKGRGLSLTQRGQAWLLDYRGLTLGRLDRLLRMTPDQLTEEMRHDEANHSRQAERPVSRQHGETADDHQGQGPRGEERGLRDTRG